MPIQLEATIEGDKQLSRRLLVMADGIGDFGSTFDDIGDELLQSFETNFDSRGALFGGWLPAKKDYGHPLLEDSGEMRGNFDKSTFPTFVKLSNPTPYFPYHQSNQPRSGKLPRRVMMKIDMQRKQFIQKAFQQHINDTIRESKRG